MIENERAAALTERERPESQKRQFWVAWKDFNDHCGHAPSMLDMWLIARGEMDTNGRAALTPLAPLEPPIQPFDHAHPDSWKYEAKGDPARLAPAPSSAGLASDAQDARPLSEYNDDHGSVVWWRFEDGKPLGEPAWIGAPSDDDWPYPFDNKGEAEQYYTHWTPHPPMPTLHAKQEAPTASDGAEDRPAGSPKESGTDEKEVSALLTPRPDSSVHPTGLDSSPSNTRTGKEGA